MVIRNELITRCDLYTRYMIYIEIDKEICYKLFFFDVNSLLNIKTITDVPIKVADQ